MTSRRLMDSTGYNVGDGGGNGCTFAVQRGWSCVVVVRCCHSRFSLWLDASVCLKMVTNTILIIQRFKRYNILQ